MEIISHTWKNKLTSIENIIIILFISSLFIIEPLTNEFLPTYIFRIPYIYNIIGAIICIYIYYKKQQLRITYIDGLLGILLIYNMKSILKFDLIPVTCLTIIIYIMAKTVSDKSKIGYILSFAGCLQVLCMYLQLFDYLPSHHVSFPMTGSFKNPGPLGGFLSICLVATITNYKNMNKWIGRFCIITLIIGVCFSDSRAAWISTLIAIYIGMKHRQIKIIKQMIVIFFVITIFGILSLLLYKTDSAKGRIVIWKISVNMLCDKPIFGKGLCSFQQEYMKYQSHYILENPDSQEYQLLGNNNHAFNEFLEIAYEQGFVGLIIVFSIIALIFYQYWNKSSVLFSSLTAFIIFSCFSYPCSVFLLMILLPLLLGSLSERIPSISFITPIVLRNNILLFASILIGITSYYWIQRERIEKALTQYIYGDDYDSLNYIRQNYNTVKYSTDFIFRYAHILYLKNEYEIAIPIVKQAIQLYPTTDKYCHLAQMYQYTNEYKLAEETYLYAIKMLPHFISPHYNLLLLYKEIGRDRDAQMIALHILENFPSKDHKLHKELKLLTKDFAIVN